MREGGTEENDAKCTQMDGEIAERQYFLIAWGQEIVVGKVRLRPEVTRHIKKKNVTGQEYVLHIHSDCHVSEKHCREISDSK